MRSLKHRWLLLMVMSLLLVSTGVTAGISVSAGPTFPIEVIVGDTNVAVSLSFTNNSTSPQDVGDIRLTNIKHTPSCGDFTVLCAGAAVEPGVFSASATGSGSEACAGISFSIAETDVVNGELTFSPDMNVDFAVGETCTIDFMVDVDAAATKDVLDTAMFPGVQTAQAVEANATHIGTGTPGFASGTSFATVLSCSVSVDKQICCGDDTVCANDNNWFDAGQQTDNSDGNNDCTALNGTEVQVRYRTVNTGDTGLFGCEITESNSTDFGGPVAVGDIAFSSEWPGSGSFMNASGTGTCSLDLEGREPDTATVSCFCSDDLNPDSTASAFDGADVECLNPMWSISKVCDDASAGVTGDGLSDVRITFESGGSETDIRCDITDNFYYQDDDCTDGVSGAFSTLYSQDNVTLTAGQSTTIFDQQIGPLLADGCNKVTASNCEALVDGDWVSLADPLDMDMDDALCAGQPPVVEVAKICEDGGLGSLGDGQALVTVEVSRAAGDVVATTVSCDVSDDIYLDDMDCSDGAAGADVVNLIDTSTSPLGAGDSDSFNANVGDGSAGIGPLMMSACNKATISSCLAVAAFGSDVDVTPTPPDDTSLDECLGQPMFCRLTGGGVTTDDTWDGTLTEGEDDTNRYTFGGQVGANTALPPQPAGEWQHNQKKGPSGSFGFHAGTASAPAGTEIVAIRCTDPGGCGPSGNPPSPNKQLDFDCVGTFKHIGKGKNAPTWLGGGANVTDQGRGNKAFDGTFHYCQVNVDDNGEGPDSAEGDTAACPADGFGEKAGTTLSNCDCPDFYRITIYDGVNADTVTFLPDGSIDPATLNTTDVIYEVEGYLGKGGNGLQLHALTGFDRR